MDKAWYEKGLKKANSALLSEVLVRGCEEQRFHVLNLVLNPLCQITKLHCCLSEIITGSTYTCTGRMGGREREKAKMPLVIFVYLHLSAEIMINKYLTQESYVEATSSLTFCSNISLQLSSVLFI